MSTTLSVSGAAAFAAVIRQWRDGVPGTVLFSEPPFARLSNAIDDPNATSMDRWILLRQALRYESLRTGGAVHANLLTNPGTKAAELGLIVHAQTGGRCEVTALPWAPKWLEGGVTAVDEVAMKAEPRRFHDFEGPDADPFLLSLGQKTYRSVAQQSAIRAALSMPAGASLIIDLPTGEGKSTVFRVVASAGFASSPSGRTPGLVVVVVPTVTLALDHERTCDGSDDQPLAYIGGRDVRNGMICDAIRSGTQRIVFAAPEAVVQSLRIPLAKAAQDGLLGAVVIDEAHLIDGWGTGFRTEFQSLAGVLNAWRANASTTEIFRTIFLSATFTNATLQTLGELFSPEIPIPIVSGARIRPEPEYWVAETTDPSNRVQRVYEAICHLPRPAILYVTKVKDAEWWYDYLRRHGFQRIALVHGGTSHDLREKALAGWNAGAIDLVVATSAFGLGIDYPHVRTVIHACLPETLDRFYQEIGRGGRDGCACVSLLIPQVDDEEVARNLSSKKVITVDRGLQRWRSMFSHPSTKCEGYPRYVVPLDVPPGYEIDDIDLAGERNTDWNQRTLALMARSGLIRLVGACTPNLSDDSAPIQLERIEILEEGHLDVTVWKARVELKRAAILAESRGSFDLLKKTATGRACPTRLVASLYSSDDRHVALVCSGCRLCREDPGEKVAEGTVPYCRPPWRVQAELAANLHSIWSAPGFAVVSYPVKAPAKRTIRDFSEAIRRLDAYGLRIWANVGSVPTWISYTVAQALNARPWIVQKSNFWDPIVWPTGARVVACSADNTPTSRAISSVPLGSQRIVLIAEGSLDPDQTSRKLADIVPGPAYLFEEFLTMVLR
jgi:ATP-dependent DNA helicase RecQ